MLGNSLLLKPVILPFGVLSASPIYAHWSVQNGKAQQACHFLLMNLVTLVL